MDTATLQWSTLWKKKDVKCKWGFTQYGNVLLFICLFFLFVCCLKRVHKTLFFSKTKQLKAMVSIDDPTWAFQRTHLWTFRMTFSGEFKDTFVIVWLFLGFFSNTTLFRAMPCYAICLLMVVGAYRICASEQYPCFRYLQFFRIPVVVCQWRSNTLHLYNCCRPKLWDMRKKFVFFSVAKQSLSVKLVARCDCLFCQEILFCESPV